jgi:serine/threonine protein kinase
VKPVFSQIGPYRVEEKIGSGGMATVYRAVREGAGGFERSVAVKVLHPHLTNDSEYIAMFHDEARLASRLAHRVLVPVTDLGEAEGIHYMVMDLLTGQTLAQLHQKIRERKKPFPQEHALRVVSEVLDGLHYAHDLKKADGTPCGVIHRDVSPGNIFVSQSGAVRLMDFGIARAQLGKGMTQIGYVKGTVPYMAPEQARGEKLDRRVDIFAAGLVLYELLTGDIPLTSDQTGPQRQALADGDLAADYKSIHLAIRPALTKALAVDPEQRYETAAEFGGDLRKVLEELHPDYEIGRLGGLARQRKKRKKARLRKPPQPDQTGVHPTRSKDPKTGRVKPLADDRRGGQPEPVSLDASAMMAICAVVLLVSGMLYTFLAGVA